jgi:hypothetical protein
MSTPDENRRKAALATIAKIRRKIGDLEFLCSGTLLRRTKVCGRKECRCARDPKARHGPYYEWSRRENDRLVHTILSDEEGRQIARSIRNYRFVRRLLRLWERATMRAIRSAPP